MRLAEKWLVQENPGEFREMQENLTRVYEPRRREGTERRQSEERRGSRRQKTEDRRKQARDRKT
jgi:hypothetical protein